MAVNEEIKTVEKLLLKCIQEPNLREKLTISKQIPEKLAAILKLPKLTAADKTSVAKLSAQWMEMQGAIVKLIDNQLGGLKKKP
ncbi:MAG: hypothetical protein WCF65_06650 [Parachlamydiaceae bacterium]